MPILLKRASDATASLVSTSIVVLSVAVVILPILVTVLLSFDARDYMGPFPPPALSLQWYARFFQDPSYVNGLQTSLALAAAATAISTVLGTLGAIGLQKMKGRRRDALVTLFLAPNALPHVVVGFALLLFFASLGIFESFGRLVAAHVLITIPYAVRVIYAALAGLRPAYMEAALNLGATERQAFREITLPMVRTSIFASIVFAFALSMDDVSVSLFLSGTHSFTLPVVMLGMMQTQVDLSIAVGAVLQCLLALATLLVLDRLIGVERIFDQGGHQS